MRNFMILAMTAGTLMIGCSDKGDDSGMTGPTGDGGTADGGTSDGGVDGGTTDGGTSDGGTSDGGTTGAFTVSGTVVDLLTFAPTGEGLCVHALDPTSVLGGDTELDIVASGVVGASGSYELTGVVMPSLLGMFVLVADCADEGTVWTSATGIPTSAYEDLGEGDTLSQTALVVDAATLAGMQASIDITGASVDLEAEGAALVFVQDAVGTPVGGATTGCSSCGTTYYADAVDADGLFTSGGALNMTTDAAAGALAVIPSAPIDSYTASIEGGAYTWNDQTFGSLPGMAVFLLFNANE